MIDDDGYSPPPTKKTSPNNWNEGQAELDEAKAAARSAAKEAYAAAEEGRARAKAINDKIAADKAAADKAAADKAAADKAAADNGSDTLTTSLITSSETKVTPTPPTPTAAPRVISPPPPPVKTAPIDTVLFEDSGMSIEIMTDLIFEDIGGHELLSISRNDIINGQQVSYSPIKNLGLIQQRYNPNNILKLQLTSDTYFANFAIKLEEKVPLEGNGPNGENVYIEEETGDLIIETINMNNDEQIQIEIAINGTIYEANFGATTS